MSKVKPIPEGYHTVTPYIIVKGADKAIDFYKRAFGAEKTFSMPAPGGQIMHAEIKVGDSRVMLSDEFPEMGSKSPAALGGVASSLHIYVEDVDTAFQRAVSAGAKPQMPPADMFWGDRYAKVEDPFGHVWGIATHKEDVSPEEMGRRSAAAFSKK